MSTRTDRAAGPGARRRVAGGIGVVLAVLSGACGGGHTSRATSPGTVAVAYLTALFDGRFASAYRLVAPSSVERQLYELTVIDLTPGSVMHIGPVRAGRQRVRGSVASVTVMGTLCSTGNRTTLASKPDVRRFCMSNTNPAATAPAFVVRETSVAGAGWRVTYRGQR